jgi:uncharacterized membrane protein
MSTSVYCSSNKHFDLPCIRRVERDTPLAWLGAGWSDFRRAWATSLPYGILLAAVAAGLVYQAADQPYLAMALAGGFLLVTPLFAAGFYQISRRLEWQDGGRVGAEPQIGRLFGTSATLFGLLLVALLAVWINLASTMTTALATGAWAMDESFSLLALFSADSLPFVASYFGIGALVAATVFCIGVVTLPMLVDRRTDLATAIATSLLVVKENPVAMAVWAALIAVLSVAGMVSLFIGFAVLLPVIGHGSWHAYRDLVEKT